MIMKEDIQRFVSLNFIYYLCYVNDNIEDGSV